MIRLYRDGIDLPSISDDRPWSILDKNEVITSVNKKDIEKNGINPYRINCEPAQATVWDLNSDFIFIELFNEIESLEGCPPVFLLKHIFWFTQTMGFELLNTQTQIASAEGKPMHVGNFFFTLKDEEKFLKEKGFSLEDIVVGSIIRRTDSTQFGLRFYDLNDPKIWEIRSKNIEGKKIDTKRKFISVI